MNRQAGALEPLVQLLRLGADDPAALAAVKALLAAAADSQRNQARAQHAVQDTADKS